MKKNNENELLEHKFKPIYDSNSKILILGSFPSVKSRQQNFYYGHEKNRFWKLLAYLFNMDVPTSIDEKINFLLKNNIAIWDVVKRCKICGSSDLSITDVTLNDILSILDKTNIKEVYFNGKTAYNLFFKYQNKDILNKYNDIKFVNLPSTSPANASYSFEKLVDCWEEIKNNS